MVGSFVVALIFLLYSTPLNSSGKEYKYKKRCKECSVVTVSNTIPLENGEPCGSCVELDCVTEDSVLTDYWKPFPDSA